MARYENTLVMRNSKSRVVAAQGQGQAVDSVASKPDNEKVGEAEGQNRGELNPGKAVQARFGIENINQTSNAFLARKDLTTRIDTNFKDQVESLRTAVDKLPTDGENAPKTAQALFTLNDLLRRYNSEAFAGFKGLGFAVSESKDEQFKQLVETYDLVKKELSDAQKQLKGRKDDNFRSQLEAQLE